MTQYLDGKKKVSFPTDSNVVSATFRTDNGKLSGANVGVATKTGWYERGNMPEVDTSPPLNSEVNSEVISEPDNSEPENSQGESQEEPSPGTSSKSEWEPSKPSKPENPHSSAPSSHSPVDGNRPGQDNNGLWVPPDT